MPSIALINKEILACRELYLNGNTDTNLALFLLGKIVSLPRSGRLCYEVEWDQASRLFIPQEIQHHVRSSIPNSALNRDLMKEARLRFINSQNSDPVPESARVERNIESQRLLQFQNLMTSPFYRRSNRVVADIMDASSSSSSSEEETDEEIEENIADVTESPSDNLNNNSDGVAVFNHTYDVGEETEVAQGEEESLETNVLLDNLLWNFEEYEHTNELLRLPSHKKTVYHGNTRLRSGVADSFKTPLEAFQVVGGYTVVAVRRLCRNSNDYIKKYVLPNRMNGLLYGTRFEDISVSEMMKFLGIMLRMSLNPIDYGGYAAYFFRDDVNIDLDENTSLTASGTKGCLVNRFDSLFVF